MATYKNDASTNSGNLTVTEIYKYGSSLLSIKDARINVQNPTGGGRNNFVRGNDNCMFILKILFDLYMAKKFQKMTF